MGMSRTMGSLEKPHLAWQYGMQLGLPRGLVGVQARELVCLATGATRYACTLLAHLMPRVRSVTPFTLHEEFLQPNVLLATISVTGESADVLHAWRSALAKPVEHVVLTTGGILRREAKGRVPVIPLPDALHPEESFLASLPILLRIASMLSEQAVHLDAGLSALRRIADSDEASRFAKHLADAIGKRILIGIAVDGSPALTLLEESFTSLSGRLAMSMPLSSALHSLPAFLREAQLAVDDVFFLFLREADEDAFTREAFEALRGMVSRVRGESMTLILKGSRLVRWLEISVRVLMTARLIAEVEGHLPGEKPGLREALQKLVRHA